MTKQQDRVMMHPTITSVKDILYKTQIFCYLIVISRSPVWLSVIMLICLSIFNHVHNILRLFDGLANFCFTKAWLLVIRRCIRVASQVAIKLKT